MLANKFRLYPNKEQTKKLEFSLDMCRQAYNLMLQELNAQVIIDKNMIQSMLPDLKICEPKFRAGIVLCGDSVRLFGAIVYEARNYFIYVVVFHNKK